MFGLQFLFAAALWTLPLAALPVVLHLLFRRRPPLVPFSTLRFIRSSLQHTARRRRVQRWMLLAVRALLLALLIWAVAQPAKLLASRWLEPGRSLIAAIVIDTSYSMQLEDGQLTLLNRADGIVQDLLRGPLKDAQVAVFRSQPQPGDRPERLESASKIQSEWTALAPQAANRPLIEQVTQAAELLKRQEADQKWLIVLSDLQSHEFPRAIQPLAEPETRFVLFDLHPDEARSAGIARVAIRPEQPLPGLASEASVEVAGRTGDSRAVAVVLSDLAANALITKPPMMAGFDAGGRSVVRFAVQVPAQPWMLLTATLQSQDTMAWDNTRTQLIEVPPRQVVTLIDAGSTDGAADAAPKPALRFLRLALDPSEGKLASWPLELRRAKALDGQENVAVLALTEWPDERMTQRLLAFARTGGTVVLCTQPGIEEAWAKLGETQRSALAGLLPSAPLPAPPGDGTWKVIPGGNGPDPLLGTLADAKLEFGTISVRRFVRFAVADGSAVTTALRVAPAGGGGQPLGLLFRRKVGNGTVYTLAALPESRFTNLATHPLFLPMMVSMCLRPAEQSQARNVELGEPLVLAGQRYAALEQVELEGPRQDRYVVKAREDNGGGRQFVFTEATEPGLYTWRRPGEKAILAVSNVQLPAAESDMVYREAPSVAPSGPNTIIARSLTDLESKVAAVSEPEPKWSLPIAVVLLLLCLEALMGSVSTLWKPLSLKSLAGGNQ